MQIDWKTQEDKTKGLEMLREYRVEQITELLKDDPEQLQQFLDLIGEGGQNAEKIIEELSS